MNRLTRPMVDLYRDIPWCHWKQIHKPDAVGRILILFGVFWNLYAIRLLLLQFDEAARARSGLVIAIHVLPVGGWAIAWSLAGLACIGSAVLVGPRPGPVGIVAAWAPPMGWSVWYVLGLFAGSALANVVLALIFAGFALLAYAIAYVVDPKALLENHE